MRPSFVTQLVGVLVLVVGLTEGSAASSGREPAHRERLQHVIDDLCRRLDLAVDVTATIVPANALLVSVEPAAGRATFVMSFQQSFLGGLSDDELQTVVAHELGHVWIFTHHPYLQTERLANDVALRVVSRDSLARVYGKVWAVGGVKGDLARFLPAPE